VVVERRGAGVLVFGLGLVVKRGGAGGSANGRPGGDVGAAVVEGVGVGVAGVAMTAAAVVVGIVVETLG